MSPSALPPPYRSRFLGSREAAEQTRSFQFEKPSDFGFEAGQFMEVTLPSQGDAPSQSLTHPFSIASAPSEPRLMITTRMRNSDFKRLLGSLPPGAEVTLAGPFGDLTLHEDPSRPAVFLTGGIGVTPFRSIVLSAEHRKLPHQILMFYSNRRPEDAAFLEELRASERKNPHFRLIPTITQPGVSRQHWNGEQGHVDAAMIERYSTDAATAIYYIAGPPRMVQGLSAVLSGAGIERERVRTEEFDGY